MKWQAIAQAAAAAAVGAVVSVAAPELAPVRAVLCPPVVQLAAPPLLGLGLFDWSSSKPLPSPPPS